MLAIVMIEQKNKKMACSPFETKNRKKKLKK